MQQSLIINIGNFVIDYAAVQNEAECLLDREREQRTSRKLHCI